MRISATGNKTAAERGFTLVELMVALVVIGLASAAVVLTMPDPRGDLRTEAERFAARAKAAQNTAVLEARPIALKVDAAGYYFESRIDGAWAPLEQRPLEPASWPATTDVRTGANGATRIIFDTTGTSDPLKLVLSRGERRASVTIAANGRINVGA